MYFIPFGPQDSEESVKVARTVYHKNPWLEEQLTEHYGQSLLTLNGGVIIIYKRPSRRKNWRRGANLPWLKHAGVIPVQSTLPDRYLSLETGFYEGWLMFPSARSECLHCDKNRYLSGCLTYLDLLERAEN